MDDELINTTTYVTHTSRTFGKRGVNGEITEYYTVNEYVTPPEE